MISNNDNTYAIIANHDLVLCILCSLTSTPYIAEANRLPYGVENCFMFFVRSNITLSEAVFIAK